MELSKASDELAKLIIKNQDGYIETLGLAIMEFNNSLNAGDTPKMALVFAKQIIEDKG